MCKQGRTRLQPNEHYRFTHVLLAGRGRQPLLVLATPLQPRCALEDVPASTERVRSASLAGPTTTDHHCKQTSPSIFSEAIMVSHRVYLVDSPFPPVVVGWLVSRAGVYSDGIKIRIELLCQSYGSIIRITG